MHAASTVKMIKLRAFLEKLQKFLMVAAFFFAPWWLWWSVLGSTTYTGYVLALVVLSSVSLWLMLGVPGLVEALKDSRRWWILGVFVLVMWAFLSPRWSLDPLASEVTAQRFAAVGLFAVAVLCAGPSARSVAFAFAAGVIVQGVVAVARLQVQYPLGLAAPGAMVWAPNAAGY